MMNPSLYSIGAVYEAEQSTTAELMKRFREASGDSNPMHLDPEFAKNAGFLGPIAYGNLLGMMVSNVVGMKLPSKAVLIVRQNLDFRGPVYVDENVRLVAKLTSVHEAVGTIALDLRFTVVSRLVATGTCVVKCL